MCSVLAVKIASADSTGHGWLRTSISSAGSKFGVSLAREPFPQTCQVGAGVAGLPEKVRQMRREVHGVLAGAAADFEDLATAPQRVSQDREDRAFVALTCLGNLIAHEPLIQS